MSRLDVHADGRLHPRAGTSQPEPPMPTALSVILLLVLTSCATRPWLEQTQPVSLYSTESTGDAVPFAAERAEAVLLAEAKKYQLELQGDGRLAALADLVLEHWATLDSLPPWIATRRPR